MTTTVRAQPTRRSPRRAAVARLLAGALLRAVAALSTAASAQSGASWPPATAEGQTWIFSAAGETWTATAGKLDSDGDRELQVGTPRGTQKGWLVLSNDKTLWSLLTPQPGGGYWACRLERGAGPVYSGKLSFFAKTDGPGEARGTCTGQLQGRAAPANTSAPSWPYRLAAGQTWSVKMPSGTVTATLEGQPENLSGIISRTPPAVLGAVADTTNLTFMVVSQTAEQLCVIERAGASGAVLTGTAYDMKSERSLGQCSAAQGPASALASRVVAVRPSWPLAPRDGDTWTVTTPLGSWKGSLKAEGDLWQGRVSGAIPGEMLLKITPTSAVLAIFADDGRIFGCRIDQLGTIAPDKMSGDALYGKNADADIEEAGACSAVQER
ncbi:hypothetical protein [Deinococcus multiflagellatus]|uniref:Secreted protein n=1 Tax=Deinococcus multiflagellatus TaxID=1656887 RepID=A0ABW1ZLZ6_9DEIO|nr:hypothetical protein [Deinococcus multiflagellatus]MBZ9715238.1 hypothetical protein [Deinococcus multiflagellatus]